jgi:hypothetical protein
MEPVSIRDKVPILTKFFGMYGRGNFDLTHDEIAEIILILVTLQDEELMSELRAIYERLEKIRMG